MTRAGNRRVRELYDLAARVEALSPPDRLRLAAGLLEERQPDVALTLIRKVEMELSAVLLLGRKEG